MVPSGSSALRKPSVLSDNSSYSKTGAREPGYGPLPRHADVEISALASFGNPILNRLAAQSRRSGVDRRRRIYSAAGFSFTTDDMLEVMHATMQEHTNCSAESADISLSHL